MRKTIFTFLFTIISFFLIFFALQSYKVYHHSFGLIAKNWENRELVKKPYEKITHSNFVQWDAVHYQNIKDNGYSIEKSGGDYIFAFFPFFPLVWKLSMLPPLGILFLNYLFLSLGLFILIRLFANKLSYGLLLTLALSLPGLAVFLIPYSEATFLLVVSLGIYGLIKNRYLLFFTGFFLASLTRPTYSFLMLAILATEFYFLLEHRNWKSTLKNTFLRILPLLLGTLTVSCIQLYYQSGSLFKFMEVQKYWGNVLQIPKDLTDWSHESFSMNVGIVFLLFIPCFYLILKRLICLITHLKNKPACHTNYTNPQYYSIVLSVIYMIGAALFIFLFRGGSLHGLFRFTSCSPFMFILLFGAFQYLQNIPVKKRIYMISIGSLLGILTLSIAPYSRVWNFSDAGFFILVFTFALWFFQDYAQKRTYKLALYGNLLLNILWTTYLINTYIANGWIFA